jgi:hypothetical protein
MQVDLYTRCWNDADMLGFFFQHYDPFVQRYVVFDDGSTDGSLDLLGAHPKVDLRAMPEYSDPQSRVASGTSVLESCWKESRGNADWVIVTDIDEHLFHPRICEYLAACSSQGITIIPALGYQMVANDFPPADRPLCRTTTLGAPSHVMNKLNIFRPDAIEATNFAHGRHTAALQGHVVAPMRDELLLLHYRFLGFERTQRRHELYAGRQRSKDLAMGWGVQYSWSREKLKAVWDELEAQLVDIARPDLEPWMTHPGPRWWAGVTRIPAVDGHGTIHDSASSRAAQ